MRDGQRQRWEEQNSRGNDIWAYFCTLLWEYLWYKVKVKRYNTLSNPKYTMYINEEVEVKLWGHSSVADALVVICLLSWSWYFKTCSSRTWVPWCCWYIFRTTNNNIYMTCSFNEKKKFTIFTTKKYRFYISYLRVTTSVYNLCRIRRRKNVLHILWWPC